MPVSLKICVLLFMESTFLVLSHFLSGVLFAYDSKSFVQKAATEQVLVHSDCKRLHNLCCQNPKVTRGYMAI